MTRHTTKGLQPKATIATFLVFLTSLFVVPALALDKTKIDPHAGHKMPTAKTTAKGEPTDSAVTPMDHNSMDMESMDHSSMNKESMDDSSMDMQSMDQSAMDMSAMDMSSMQGGSAPADARDPHAYAGGQDFGPYPLHLGDTLSFTSLLVENLELAQSNGNTSGNYDLQGWHGRIYDRAVLKSEGEFQNGRLEDARTELLWGHAISSFWDTQLGYRFDNGEGPDRSWLAFGVQGLAPYWFEMEATGYIGKNGRTALRLDASYELLFTQKLILQPRIEAEVYGKSDSARGIGSGLTDITASLRLRYAIRREFAPYLGVEWTQKFGKTKNLARAAGADASEVQFVAGLRYWF